MALSSRYDGISSKRLRHAFALQEIESSPASDEEISLYRRMQGKGWPEKTQAKVMRRVVIGKAVHAVRRTAGKG